MSDQGSWIRSGVFASVFLLLISVTVSAGDDKGDALFKNAKKKTVAQNWEAAISMFEQFIHEFKGHSKEDDAYFWLAYCLEKKDPADIQAFLAYDELIQAFPRSPWADDAVVHQAGLAARFVEAGKEEFRGYLVDLLQNENIQIRQQTAIALGKIGDAKALPVLKTMAGDSDFYELVDPLIRRIESTKGSDETVIAAKTKTRSALEITTSQPDRSQSRKNDEKTWEWSGVLPTYRTTRYRQYDSMLRTDKNWSSDELIDFGMWTILSTDEFENYHRFTGYDRSEWLRKYWKKLDPTPTTPLNEAYEEFKSRVNYAYANFSDTWDYRELKYKREMYQRDGWPNAPWDARGELYIKYGPPQFLSLHGWHTEEWTYYKYNVDFIVHLYETNIYYEAIYPGALSQITYKEDVSYVDAAYINHPEFRYYHEYNVERLELRSNRFYTENGFLKFDYTIAIKDLGFEKKGDLYQFNCDLTVVIMDGDMREIFRQEVVKSFQRENKKAWKRDKYFDDQIRLKLVPGPYTIVIQIKDKYSNKMGIYLKNLDTSRPPD